MTLTLKSVLAAAVLAAVSLAHARAVTVTVGSTLQLTDNERDEASTGRTMALRLQSGSGALQFSNGTGVIGALPPSNRAVGGLVGALNVGKVSVTGVDGAVVTETKTLIGRSQTRAMVDIAASVTSLSLDSSTGQILGVTSVGGARQDAVYLEGVLNGGSLTVNNLRFDLANNKVFADMSGTPLVYNSATGLDEPGATVSWSGIHLWDIGAITGPTALSPEAWVNALNGDFSKMEELGFTLADDGSGQYDFLATNTLSKLTVTTTGFDFFARALGLTPGSTGYTTLAGVNDQSDGWGSITSTIRLGLPLWAVTPIPEPTPSIPEPSTYALMGLGLVGVFAASRRRS